MKKILFLILMNVSILAGAQSAGELFARAKAEQNTPARIKLLTQAIEKNKYLPYAYQYRGDAYKEQGKLNAAVADYTAAIKLKPKDAYLYHSRAVAYIAQKKYSSAEEDLNKAIKLKNNAAVFYFNRAAAQLERAKYALAIKDYQKYASLNKKKKKDPLYYLGLGRANAGIYKYHTALEMTDAYIKLAPAAPEGYFNKGYIYYYQGRYDEAVAALSKAINRNPAYAPAYRLRASAFKAIKDYPASAEDYTSLLALTPDFLFYNRRGLVYEEMKEYKLAAADYTAAINLNPRWPITYNNRAYCELHLKQWAAAKKDLDAAIKLDPSLSTPYINLAGYYWLHKKDKKNALKNLDMAINRSFKDYDSLHGEGKKAWLFKNLNTTPEFRALLYK